CEAPCARRTAGEYGVTMAGRLRMPASWRAGMTVALALAVCAAAPCRAHGATSSQRPATGPLGGVNVIGLYSGVSPAVADRQIAAARKLHAKVVRAELRWSTLEPVRPNDVDAAALAFTDRLVGAAAAAGIRVIFTVDSTPCWASSAPASLLRNCVPRKSTPANAWPPTDPASYAAAVAYLAHRYGAKLAGIEIWNEPD